MREIDRLTTERHGITSLELMENAAGAIALAAEILSRGAAGKRILVLCGKGNNGGDGAAVARLLASAGAIVDVILLGAIEETRSDARINFERLQSWNEELALRADRDSDGKTKTINLFQCDTEETWTELLSSVLTSPHDLVVDALFGTGLTRAADGIHREAISYVNGLRAPRDAADRHPQILSIDIPSGLNSDSAELVGEAVHADVTVTMTAPKIANVLAPAANPPM